MSDTAEAPLTEFPQSPDAERGVLGSILLSPSSVMDVAESQVPPEYFHIPAHRTIYHILLAAYRGKLAIDFITLTQQLRDEGELDAVGGPAYVTELFTFVPTAANVDYYIAILREKFLLRRMIIVCNSFAGRAYQSQDDDPDALLQELQSEVIEIGQITSPASSLRHVREGISTALESADHAFEHRGTITGVPTGFVDLDRMTGGLKSGQMLIIAARPGNGKSSLVMNIAEHVTLTSKLPVALFTPEMTYDQVCNRLLFSHAGIDHQRLRDGFMKREELQHLGAAGIRVASAPLFIDDKAGLTIFEFRARARQAVLSLGAKLIIVDYLQKMKSTSRRAMASREQEIAEISDGLVNTAKELGVPIIVCSQLSRETERRTDGRPKLSDLRESGAIEQDAHIVAFIYRRELYIHPENEEMMAEHAGKAELDIAKHRDGPMGSVNLTFDKHTTRFQSTTTHLFSNNPEHRQHDV